MSVASPYYCRDIETAVKHPLWSKEEQEAMVLRHNKRIHKRSGTQWR